MKIIRSPKIFQKSTRNLRLSKKSVGFVPTMGALHEGHLSLVRRAKKENDIVVVSIFVNPTQFGPKEDFKKYPRPLARDVRLLKKERVNYLFHPTAKSMYPEGFQTFTSLRPYERPTTGRPPQLTRVLCGKSRPGHFDGVMTIVGKLFNIVQPTRAYFGAKDYQQARIIEQMTEDLNFNVELKLCPIIREPDGLALSSRNKYLSRQEREDACEISRTLHWISREIKRRRNQSLAVLKSRAKRRLAKSVKRIDYLEIVDPQSLATLKRKQGEMLIACACFVGKTRLIDNAIIRLPRG